MQQSTRRTTFGSRAYLTKTVTLPVAFGAEVGRSLAAVTATGSCLVADALHAHLHQLRLQDMINQAAGLDLEEELVLAIPLPADSSRSAATIPPGLRTQ